MRTASSSRGSPRSSSRSASGRAGALRADLRKVVWYGPLTALSASVPRGVAEHSHAAALALVVVVIFGAGLLPVLGSPLHLQDERIGVRLGDCAARATQLEMLGLVGVLRAAEGALTGPALHAAAACWGSLTTGMPATSSRSHGGWATAASSCWPRTPC